LHAYGLNLGMAFQIVDDILDYCACGPQLGKDVGDDFREGKITLPLILAYPDCDHEEKEFLRRTLIDHDQTPDDLSVALEILEKRNGLTKAYNLAATYGERALNVLESIPSHPIKDLLVDLVDHCLQRKS
jgi:octaprenyl-diphosphate synthase